MKRLERLADWISGGALTRETKRADDCRDRFHKAIDRLDMQQGLNGENLVRLSRARLALRAIAACETPSANATVRKMARIAREALK